MIPRAIKCGIPGGAIFESRGTLTKLIGLHYKKIDSEKPPLKEYDNPVSDIDLKSPAKPNRSIDSKEPPTLLNQQSQPQKLLSPHNLMLHHKSI